MEVINNTRTPSSTLKEKSNEICYHELRESVAMGETLTAHVDTHENLADLATKILLGGMKRNYLIDKIPYHVVDHDETEQQADNDM